MHKEIITYVDYNGIERTEELYFNLTEQELIDMQLTTAGGYTETVKAIIDAKDQPALIAIFKELLHKAHGKKTPDGRRFIKSQEILDDFIYSPAYSKLYMRLVTDDQYAAKFISGLIPAELAEKVKAQKQLQLN
jgi:hypothetical protein